MPVYVHCPHCEHPQVVPPHRRGKMRFCRQCGRAYLTSESESVVHALPISSVGELRRGMGVGRRVYILGA